MSKIKLEDNVSNLILVGIHEPNPQPSTNVQDQSPHMSFILKGSQISIVQLKGWFKSKNIEMKLYKTHIKLMHEL